MTKNLSLSVALASLLILAVTQQAWSVGSESPHYDLEMTGDEYSKALSNFTPIEAYDGDENTALQKILATGKRNLDWVKFINEHRDAGHQISLSSAATQAGIPIDHPRFYNPQIITKDYEVLLGKLPTGVKEVVTGTGSLPLELPLDDASFVTWSMKIDGSYQMASRWILLSGYLEYLGQRQANDVRGYYFLSRDPNLKDELKHWGALHLTTQYLYRHYLEQMCLNNNEKDCAATVRRAVAKNAGYDLYAKYLPGSKVLYDSFFIVQVPRHDVTWNADQMLVPFTLPTDAVVKNFLVDNIQDEWKWKSWQLTLRFLASGENPSIVFEAGATPRVNQIGGNTITMDANEPLTDYNVNWTIRHEFGHVLGFPDCYVEFYDKEKAVMVSYQLDITNIMCSRKGHVGQLHYDQLKEAYSAGLSESNLLKNTER